MTATHKQSEQTFTATSDENGKYLLRNLPGGSYTVIVEAAGFKKLTTTDVSVQSSNLTKLDCMLQVGAVTETVEITSGRAELVQTTSQTVAARQITVAARK